MLARKNTIDDSFQLNDGTRMQSSVPVNVIGLSSGVVSVSLGGVRWVCEGHEIYFIYITSLGVGLLLFAHRVLGCALYSDDRSDVGTQKFACALLMAGTVKCWGDAYGHTPAIDGVSGAVSISSGFVR